MTFSRRKSHLHVILAILLLLLSITKGHVKLEIVNNYLGHTVIFYDQEITNSTNMTSYEVNSMMTCRLLRNTTLSTANPLNIVSVGTYDNGTISCKIGNQEISNLKLETKPGMITFLTRPGKPSFPAKSGLFYMAPRDNAWVGAYATTLCPANWNFPYAITPTLKDELNTFMKANGLTVVIVAATCSGTTQIWNDGTPFNYSLAYNYNGPWTLYFSTDQFACGYTGHLIQLVCVLNIYSIPWEEL